MKKKKIIDNISLKVQEKKIVGIIGANGSGKSTILKSIYKTIKPVQGSIYLNDTNVLSTSPKKVAQSIGVVSQFNQINFDLTVYQMVLLGRTPHKKYMETDNSIDHEITEEALRTTGLLSYKNRSFLTLSGGEKQRVILARTIAQQPKFLILDEPTNHLDVKYQLEILETVKDLNISVLAVLHDIDSVINYCDYVYALKDRTVISEGVPNEVITTDLLENIFDVKCAMYINPLTGKRAFTFYLGKEEK